MGEAKRRGDRQKRKEEALRMGRKKLPKINKRQMMQDLMYEVLPSFIPYSYQEQFNIPYVIRNFPHFIL